MCAVFGSSVRSQASEQKKIDHIIYDNIKYALCVCACVCVCVCVCARVCARVCVLTFSQSWFDHEMSSMLKTEQRRKHTQTKNDLI